jgi:uncharacterized membrane protein
MTSGFVLLLAITIGIVAGLRSLTAPAIVAGAAHIGWLNLNGSPLHFMGSTWTVTIFTALALGEFVADVLPNTPSRTAPVGLSARIVTGGLSGASMAVAGGAPIWLGAALGAVGGVAGAFGGYQGRVGLVRALHVSDFTVAIPEDLIAIGLGVLVVSRF